MLLACLCLAAITGTVRPAALSFSKHYSHSKQRWVEQIKLQRVKRSPGEKEPMNDDVFDMLTQESFRWVDDVFTNHDPKYYNYTGYNSFKPMERELYRLEEQYKSFVRVEKFGTTYENRDLLAIHINKKKSKDIVVLNSLIHAREWISGAVTMNIIHRLLKYRTRDARILRDAFHFIIIPCLNPDGYEYSMFTNRMWRKNREPIPGSDCKGVDLNRNFLYGFKSYPSDHEENGACSEIYSGSKALSTKESNALAQLLQWYKPSIRYYVDYHAYGNMWLNAYGATNWLPRNDLQLKRYRKNVEKSFTMTLGRDKWKTGNVYDVLYECHGIVLDHAHYYITPLSYTVEIGNEIDEFSPPDTRISTYTISQWLAVVSQLKLLKTELNSGAYEKDRRLNWRSAKLQKRETQKKRGTVVPDQPTKEDTHRKDDGSD